MSNLRFLPSDIYAIKKVGIQVWQENFFWPISNQVYFKLLDEIWEGFDELYQKLDGITRDLILADTNFINVIAQYIHGRAVQSFCSSKNVHLISENHSKDLYYPDWEVLSKAYQWSPSFYEVWKVKGKRFLKRLKYNAHTSKKNYKPNNWSLGSFSELKAEYVKAQSLYCDHPFKETILPSSIHLSKFKKLTELEGMVQVFLEKLLDYCRNKFQFEFNILKIKKCWLNRINDLFSIYNTIYDREFVPEKLLLSEVGKPLNKSIALALKKRGTKVIGFSHGHDAGIVLNRLTPYNEYSHCDYFVCPTKKSAELHSYNHNTSEISRFNRVKFITTDTTHYEQVWKNSQKEPFPEEIKSVMIVGYPMNAQRYQYTNVGFFIFMLDLEIRIAKLLKKCGFKVIYKMHPERKGEAKGIFKGLVDSIITKPLETVYGEADALFFGYIHSSTFGFSLCTNRPIFQLDISKDIWNPLAYEHISRRTVMIPAYFDEKNRIQFDEAFLLEKLNQKPERDNSDYVKKFMIPTN